MTPSVRTTLRCPAARLRVEALEDRCTPSFGAGGVVVTDLDAGDGNHRSTALQADGKIVVAGQHQVARFNPDGSPDTTFNGTGVRSLIGVAQDVEVMDDGRIVVGGYAGPVGSEDFYLARLLPDGTPDPTFSGDGVATTGFKKGNGARDRAYDIAVQADGRVVAVGEINGQGLWGVARFTASGALDTTFSGDGWLTDAFDKQNNSERADAVEVQGDGKIVVAGRAYRAATSQDLVAVRYNANGTLDGSFGSGGKVWIDFGPEAGLPYTIESQEVDLGLAPAGGIVLAGYAADHLAIARLTPMGALDPTFAGDGRLLTRPPGWGTVSPTPGHNLAVQDDGKIVVTANQYPGDTAVGRINADGSADTSFDGDGWRTFQFADGLNNTAYDVLVQPDGKIVVVGTVYVDGRSLVALARFNPDGTFDDAP